MSFIKITRPDFCWLFGGLGFHNSEATMLRMMPEDFLNERVLKTFREISPGFSRVFAGYADWTREAMDAFADYYDLTFRQAGTTLYLVPGRMPMPTDDFDCDEYAERVAEKLDYLVNVRKLTKIRYYCCTNEMSCGNTYAYLKKHLDLFTEIHTALFKAFRRRRLDIGLMALDGSGIENFDEVDWASQNIDEITETYCVHNYRLGDFKPGDKEVYNLLYEAYKRPVAAALKKEKRCALGEFGVQHKHAFRSSVMRNDVCYGFDDPEESAAVALTLAEDAMAAVNAGMLAAANWTMVDYPNPMLREDGDTEEEKIRYDVARFSGHGLSIRYNKCGLLRWDDDRQDYSSRPSMYAVGLLAKYMRKGSRVLAWETDDDELRACAVNNPDCSLSLAVVNIGGAEKNVSLELGVPVSQPMRRYTYRADCPPFSDFNDLQPFDALIGAENGGAALVLPPRSLTLLTTDYVDRVPSKVENVRLENGLLAWDACGDGEHCYYRVFENGRQIASTVAEYLKRPAFDGQAVYAVCSVDKFGNAGTI